MIISCLKRMSLINGIIIPLCLDSKYLKMSGALYYPKDKKGIIRVKSYIGEKGKKKKKRLYKSIFCLRDDTVAN